MGKRITKERTIREFRANARVSFRIECNICGEEAISDTDGIALDAAESLGYFEKQLWNEGWRFSVSKTYGHVGIHCSRCHLNRNNPDQ